MNGSMRLPGCDHRGNSRDRRARKLWLLRTFGDGTSCACKWCGRELTYASLTCDRFPVCGHRGGRYVRVNVVPACMECNVTRRCQCGAAAAVDEHREQQEAA